MTLVDLAKKAVESYISKSKIISPPSERLEEFLNKKSGTFVTIKKNDELRGCIGTYLPTKKNIVKEVIDNAIAAATEDYRFGPIQKEELPHLSYTVYILNEPELVYPVKSREAEISPKAKLFNWVKDIKELDPKKFGIIVKTAPILSPDTDVVFNGHMPSKSGLLLPDLEGINTVEQQISIACQKGGINPAREKILIYKFTVEKYQ